MCLRIGYIWSCFLSLLNFKDKGWLFLRTVRDQSLSGFCQGQSPKMSRVWVTVWVKSILTWSLRRLPRFETARVEKKPSLTDPVASIFSPGFRKKRHWVGKFSIGFPLSVRSLFCHFQTYSNEICWVCKSSTGEATNWPGKIKNFTRYREEGKKIRWIGFHWVFYREVW